MKNFKLLLLSTFIVLTACVPYKDKNFDNPKKDVTIRVIFSSGVIDTLKVSLNGDLIILREDLVDHCDCNRRDNTIARNVDAFSIINE